MVFFFIIIFVTGCSLAVSTNLGSPSPLLVAPGTNTAFRASDAKGTLSFAVNQNVLLACPGAGNYLTVTGGQEAIATCVDATSFTVNGVKYEMNQLKCFKVCLEKFTKNI